MITDAIAIGVDCTDHVAFFCPHEQCKRALRVDSVRTQKVIVDATVPHRPKYDKCTWIHLKCPMHGPVGQRKFYWTCETGEYCEFRTDKPDVDPLATASMGQ